jgi:protein-arginine kinase activator protein McsA
MEENTKSEFQEVEREAINGISEGEQTEEEKISEVDELRLTISGLKNKLDGREQKVSALENAVRDLQKELAKPLPWTQIRNTLLKFVKDFGAYVYFGIVHILARHRCQDCNKLRFSVRRKQVIGSPRWIYFICSRCSELATNIYGFEFQSLSQNGPVLRSVHKNRYGFSFTL